MAASPAGAQTSPICIEGEPSAPNVVWRGSQRPTYRLLAECAAPILWPSPDEIFAPGGPEPYDPPPAGCKPGIQAAGRKGPSTVYFRYTNPAEGRSPNNLVSLADERELGLRYFLFYGQDPDHCGDLEGAHFTLQLFQVNGAWEAQLDSVHGFAHGNAFLGNHLLVGRDGKATKDIRLPVTLLIEQDKHATTPDRNGDGLYTPGYDVNVGTHDAWGLRDNFGSGMVSTAFEASMAKMTRITQRELRLFPNVASQRDALVTNNWARGNDTWPATPRQYELEHTSAIRAAPGEHDPRTDRKRFINLLGLAASFFSFRYDGQERALAFSYPLISEYAPSLRIPWLRWTAGLRFVVSRSTGRFDLLLTPSLGGRLTDWYVAAGRFHREEPERQWRLMPYEYEIGLRVRIKPTWLRDMLPIFGARVGVRTDSWSARGARVVVEVGGGLM